MRRFLVTSVVLVSAAACGRAPRPVSDAAAMHPAERTTREAPPAAVANYCPPAGALAIASSQEFVAALTATIEPHSAGDAFAQLSEVEQTAVTVEQLDREVRRGGFAAYFTDPVGDHALDALAALRRIGATETASILERGVAIFGPGDPPRNDATRRAQIAALGDGTRRFWAALDGVYLRGPDDLDALLSLYVRSRAQGHCPPMLH